MLLPIVGQLLGLAVVGLHALVGGVITQLASLL